MNAVQSLITIVYYLLVGYTAVIIVTNLIRTRKWDREILYLIVLLPFLLRLFRLK